MEKEYIWEGKEGGKCLEREIRRKSMFGRGEK